MKEATGELNMTLVTIIAIAAVLLFVSLFLPNMLKSVGDRFNSANNDNSTNNAILNNGGGGGGSEPVTPGVIVQ